MNAETEDMKLAKMKLRAEQGEPLAQIALGVMYFSGIGAPKDVGQAMKWIRLSAEQGLASAQHFLGLLYRKGRGVPQDYVQAYHWFNLAEAQGDENAKKAIAEVQTKMTPDQIDEAQKLSREFKPKIAMP